MPRLWLEYCEFLMSQKLINRTRQTLDNALKALPVTQHDRIWKLYTKFVTFTGIVQLGTNVYDRYLCYDPNVREDFVQYLLDEQSYGQAAEQLAKLLQDENFVSKEGNVI